MFKSARWRSEKNKIKAVFKLQFHATQVPQLGKDTLMVSLVPVDVGRPTVRLEKVAIHDGSCRWENPIYETVKLIQETKTGKVNEKKYHFIVSTGSSKAGVLGEVTLDFADYCEAIKPSCVSLPLKISNSGAILHVTIQRMHGAANQRDAEENGDAMADIEDKSLRNKFSDGNADENTNCNTEVEPLNETTIQNAVPNGDHIASKVSDVTSASGSETSPGQDTPRELRLENSNSNHDPGSLLSPLGHGSMPRKPSFNAIMTRNGQEHRRTNTDWSVGSAPDISVDGSTNSSEDSLKRDLVALARHAEVSDLELQTLRKQIVKESKRGQKLSREVLSLKDERDALKQECEQLKASQRRNDNTNVSSKMQFENVYPQTLLQEIRQELNYEKELNTNLRLQLEKTQESNSELILAVRNLDEMLEQKNREISSLSNNSASNEKAKELYETVHKHEADEDEEQEALELLVREHNDAKETHLLEQKIIDLYGEIDIYRRDRDELEMQMEQLALDYEILKQENHDILAKLEQNYLQEQLKAQYDCSGNSTSPNELEIQVESLERELTEKKEEYSASLGTINELQSQVRWLEKELDKQTQGFETELDALRSAKTEMEQRAMQAEEASRKTKISHANTAQRLQEELQSQVKLLEKELDEQAQGFEAELDALRSAKTEQEQRAIQAEDALRKTKMSHANTAQRLQEELQSQVKLLEKELDEQALGFETDLEALSCAKVGQEQRAIRAEEVLRKTRMSNAHNAERLQEEFRRLSIQMASTFEANEKLGMKAAIEANELRLQKNNLEEMLEKVNEELGLVKDQYEEKLKVLSDQTDLATKKAEQLLLELEDKTKKLEHQQKHEEEMREAFSNDMLILRDEIDKLRGETHDLSKQVEQKEALRVETENLKMSISELELLVRRGSSENDELERKVVLLQKEADKSLEEINSMRALKDEKERMVANLLSELEALRAQYDTLKKALYEDELEKENLRKQVFDLKVDLKRKEDKINASEKKLKESSGRITVFDGTKPNSKNNKSALNSCGSKEVASLREKIRLLEGQIKLKEAALENKNNSFLEKEKDLSSRIEELENRVIELNQNISTYCEEHFQKEAKATEDLTTRCNGTSLLHSSNGTCSEDNELTSASHSPNQGQLDELMSEMGLLRERNTCMADELKDMQERYSEISLKFAEVEGERQKLVMTVRSLKNGKK